MRWGVTVSGPLNDGVLVTTENGVRTDNQAVAMRGFDPPTVIPPGSGKLLNLYVRQDLIQIPSRGIVAFTLDDTPVYWGVVVVSPPATSPGAGPHDSDRDALERVTVVGGEELVRDSMLGPSLWTEKTDVAAIAHKLCNLCAHPALTVSTAYFPVAGQELSTYYAPTMPLSDALDKLIGTLTGGGRWWVDASGAIHFEANTPTGSSS